MLVAAIIGGYLALNIGANDVANNVGPAVGSKAISMTGALILAMVFEMGGTLIAGGDVVATIQTGIIKADAIGDTDRFIWLMTVALLAGAVWLNVATAWVITVPVAALPAALIYYAIFGRVHTRA